jgi:NADH-quinone oxidoreductase subunit L
MQYAVLVLLFPLVGALLAALVGPWLTRRAIAWVNVGVVFLAFATVVALFLQFLGRAPANRFADLTLFSWEPIGTKVIHLGLLLDPVSLLFMAIITGVGALIHLYSVGYMGDDPGFSRYFSYLNIFIVAMLLLVMADNFVFLLIGWAGVGLASYLLIGFWYERPSAVAAAKKAFVVNVVGDVGIMLAIFLIFLKTGHITYASVFRDPAALGGSVELVAFLLFLGAAAKSAQFPLHVWLPDAMEGPTPVSALIHAATMVTAGVYLVARSYPIFHLAPLASDWVAGIGAFTALFAATIAVTQLDIKRVLAYSTVSQLGYMFMAVGTAAYSAGLLHFMTHAFFKALLFLAAGSVIHALAGEQDMRKMGGLAGRMPITYWTFLAATLAITGIPGFSGFFSKDAILGTLLNEGHVLIWIVGVLTAGITAFYMFRLFFRIFFGTYKGDAHPHESPPVMTVPLIILAVLSVIGGYVAIPGLPDQLAAWLRPAFSRYAGGLLPASAAAPNWASMGISVLLVLIGFYAAYSLYKVERVEHERVRERLGGLYTILFNKYYIDEIGTAIFVWPTEAIGRLMQVFDAGGLGAFYAGIAQAFQAWGENLRPIQTGLVRRYAMTILLGAVALVAYLSLRG